MAVAVVKRNFLTILVLSMNVSFLSPTFVFIQDAKNWEKTTLIGNGTHLHISELLANLTWIESGSLWKCFGFLIGVLMAWPFSRFGTKNGLIYSNVFRFIAATIHFLFLRTILSLRHTNEAEDEPWHSSPFLDFFSSGTQFFAGLYFSLSTALSTLYIYGISPTEQNSGPKYISFYFLLVTIVNLVLSWTLPSLTFYPKLNSLAWFLNGSLSVFTALLQILLLSRFIPDKARSSFAPIIKSDLSLCRSSALVTLLTIYLAFHAIFYSLVVYLATRLGSNLTTIFTLTILLIICAFFHSFCKFSTRPVTGLKQELFGSYIILMVVYFVIGLCAVSQNNLKPNLVISLIIVFLGCVSTLVLFKGPIITTVILVHEYPCKEKRARNVVCSFFLGFGFSFILIVCTVYTILILETMDLLSLASMIPWMVVAGVVTAVGHLEKDGKTGLLSEDWNDIPNNGSQDEKI